jgi:hypothetical protein
VEERRGSSSFFHALFPSAFLVFFLYELELELELIQTHMTQKPLLWIEVGAHAVRKRSECARVVWAGEGAAWRLYV